MFRQTLMYTNADGIVVRLVVPWGSHSGRIPPPTITFVDNGVEKVFVYTDTKYKESKTLSTEEIYKNVRKKIDAAKEEPK